MTLKRKEEKLNKNEIKQRKKLLQNKESLKRQKEDLRNIRKTQNKLNREKSKTKLKHGAREKGDEKMKFSLFSSKKKRKKTVQDSLPYLRMLRDGICQIDVNKFNKTIRFYDINYQLSTEEDKEAIFNQFSDFLNYFDPNVDIQFSYINHIGKNEEVEKNIFIPQRKDAFNEIRQEYTQMLRQQSQKGNRGLSKNMYLTFTLEASDLREGKLRLEKMEIDLLNNFKKLGVKAYVLNGYERLKLMHDLLNSEEKFVFSFDDLKHSGLSTKDYIAPPSFNFSKVNEFNIGPYTGEVNFLQILAPELSDRMLAEFLSVEENMVVSFHINSIDQTEAIKMIKRKITDLDKMKIEENKKAIRAGYDMDILPSDLVTYGNDAKKLLVELQNHNERMFVVSILFLNMEKSRKKLKNILFQLNSIAGRHNCILKNLNYRQEQGLMSSLPLGHNLIEINRGLTTSSTAVFIPFTTEELCLGGESLYYGLNALSRNIIMADRKLLKNPNGLILGTPGSGKSFSAKREITNAFLITGDDIIICDPESEYGNLTKALGGEVIKISPTSKDYINPLDINADYADEDNPLSLKSDFILSLFELVVGKEGLSAEETSVIDRCLPILYEKYFEDPIPENMPILEDLYNLLKEQKEKVGAKLAVEMEIYVKGSLNVFNHRTNVDTSNRILCYDIKELGKQLRKIGMLIVQDQVWNRVTINRNKKETRYYCDEFHLLLREEQTASYSVEIWKRFRKWGGMPTGLTQNVKDLLASAEIENIFDNTDFILMLNQAGGDREILAEKLNISLHQLSYVTNSNEGEGLLFYGNTIVPFVDRFPKDTKLYRLMTTKPEELKED
ncbi:VirB4-like conjugal transfer ATPase, CD1110 family [Enterococcus faecalis]|uniref:VirB4-like conjugal transfer ATPase, CD1110 family n=1 Tax=Enterococcus faecalis TaxID=1351 RepID=UPI003CCC6907